ncbi:MAG TPA: hypothetical protein VNV36_21425 [Pseudomonas sp.]|uniref:hypothetical protein n=1 Tax=Pseudomonas sp. TaxID=306 RepID=UPI002B9A0F05|nr:hypothetical protein [Pseudomonas sp.]HWH89318.1 hypothetical protein [Pseudomonas sp.]
MKTNQLLFKTGGDMKKAKQRPPEAWVRSLKTKRLADHELTASQRRLLQLLITGIEDEPSVLAAGRL